MDNKMKMSQVETLEDLTLKRISERIRPMLVRHIGRCGTRSLRYRELKNGADELRKMLLEWTPPGAESKLTALLLDEIDIYINEQECYCCGDILRRNVKCMVQAVLNPKVVRIGPVIGNDGAENFSAFQTYLVPLYIRENLHLFRNLKILNLRTKSFRYINTLMRQVPKGLTEFYGTLDGDTLEKLVRSSPGLRVLVLSGAERITESSVPRIVKLKKLKVLEIEMTNIPVGYISKHYPDFLNQLDVFKEQIQYF